jgi:hypothetical protein
MKPIISALISISLVGILESPFELGIIVTLLLLNLRGDLAFQL